MEWVRKGLKGVLKWSRKGYLMNKVGAKKQKRSRKIFGQIECSDGGHKNILKNRQKVVSKNPALKEDEWKKGLIVV
jgi:hypothetical protein